MALEVTAEQPARQEVVGHIFADAARRARHSVPGAWRSLALPLLSTAGLSGPFLPHRGPGWQAPQEHARRWRAEHVGVPTALRCFREAGSWPGTSLSDTEFVNHQLECRSVDNVRRRLRDTVHHLGEASIRSSQ
jgi:hypothetical protein